MNPTIVTFVDDKMLPLALEQADNAASFGLKHEIIRLTEVNGYGTDLWLDLIDRTMDAIHRHGKVLRLDAEVRLHQTLPSAWVDNDNVLFQPWPIAKDPFYIAVNTGQMILGRSGLGFLEILKECMLAMIPPDGDTSLPRSGEKHHVEDEWPSGIAIRLSGIRYVQERLCHDRRLAADCAANRGTWLEPQTILTHPAIHNWDLVGAGLTKKEGCFDQAAFINHFAPQRSSKEVEFISKLLLLKNNNHNQWSRFADTADGEEWFCEGWSFLPSQGSVRAPLGQSYKMLVSQPSQIST